MLNDDSNILIITSRKPIAIESTTSAVSLLEGKGYNILLEQPIARDLKKPECAIKNQKPDLILVFGGDGTILKTFQKWQEIPILGVNCGRVGFLTEINPEDLSWAIEELGKKDYFIQEFKTVAVSSDAYPSLSAVNDVVIAAEKPGHIMKLQIEINGKLFYVIEGDGVIISSSAGSSAYSRSAGGPLIMPNVDAFCLVPINPFIINVSPIVLAPDTKIRITNAAEFRLGLVIVDGQAHYTLDKDDILEITKSEYSIKFIRFSDNYIERVRKKLLEKNL